MPYTAHSVDEDDLVFVAQADAEAEFNCIWCPEPVSYVRAHTRNGSDQAVDAHFRYYNCTHGTVDELADNDGGGGGGESLIHRRRKAAAMQEALNRFDSTDYDTERQIGSKRADAVVVFEEPHQEYGKGLVIEYQHKNEGKDIAATEEHFARNEYTTVWLWEEQFDLSSSVPDIDLFGGRVYTPWPDAVPSVENWTGSGFNNKIRKKWASAYEDGLTESVVTATFPRHFFLPTQKEFWRAPHFTYFGEFMPSPDWEERFDPPEEFLLDWDYSEVPAKIPPEYFDQESAKIWEQQDWDSLFTTAKSKKYLMQSVVPRSPTTRSDIVHVPREIFDTRVYQCSNWERMFCDSYLPEIEKDKNVKIEIDIAPFIHKDFWRYHYYQSKPGAPNDTKLRREIKERVVRIIHHNTGGPQPDSIDATHINLIASHGNANPNDTKWAINALEHEGAIKKTADGGYQLLTSKIQSEMVIL